MNCAQRVVLGATLTLGPTRLGSQVYFAPPRRERSCTHCSTLRLPSKNLALNATLLVSENSPSRPLPDYRLPPVGQAHDLRQTRPGPGSLATLGGVQGSSSGSVASSMSLVGRGARPGLAVRRSTSRRLYFEDELAQRSDQIPRWAPSTSHCKAMMSSTRSEFDHTSTWSATPENTAVSESRSRTVRVARPATLPRLDSRVEKVLGSAAATIPRVTRGTVARYGNEADICSRSGRKVVRKSARRVRSPLIGPQQRELLCRNV